MNFVRTEYPYGGIAFYLILGITKNAKYYFAIDKMGRWRITQETYEELEKRGVKVYGREYPAT